MDSQISSAGFRSSANIRKTLENAHAVFEPKLSDHSGHSLRVAFELALAYIELANNLGKKAGVESAARVGLAKNKLLSEVGVANNRDIPLGTVSSHDQGFWHSIAREVVKDHPCYGALSALGDTLIAGDEFFRDLANGKSPSGEHVLACGEQLYNLVVDNVREALEASEPIEARA